MSLPWKKKTGDDPDREVDTARKGSYRDHIMRPEDVEKNINLGNDIAQKEVVTDQDVIGGATVTKEDAQHMGELTPEEEIESKKLRKKIDWIIMPLVMSVCDANPRSEGLS